MLQARLIGIAQRRQVGVTLVLKVVNVLRPNQSITDEPNLYAIIGAQDARISGGGHCGRESPACRGHLAQSYQVPALPWMTVTIR